MHLWNIPHRSRLGNLEFPQLVRIEGWGQENALQLPHAIHGTKPIAGGVRWTKQSIFAPAG